MTDAELNLCRAIAEAEGRNQSRCYYKPLPAYLTDPAQTMRMLKELLQCTWNGREYIVCGDGGWMKQINADCDLEHAVPEAYMAMLAAREEQDDEHF